jgi:anti-sigma regulatory factor (Ser/Thr protein kinase)
VTAADRNAQVWPADSPYLLTAATHCFPTALPVIGDVDMAVVEVAAHGQWSPQLGERISAAVRMCLAGPCASIFINLRDLDDPHGASVPFWLELWRQARFATAPAQMTFCLPVTTALSRRLRHLRGPQPRVFATVAEARSAIAERITRADQRQAHLEPRRASVKAARDLVTQACHAWQLPGLLQDTWLIVSELAANAVEHARTDFIVTVSRSGTRLHVGIHECLSRFPPLDEPKLVSSLPSLGERGRGLQLVHTIADAWGTVPTRDGKVVWATVR